MEGFCLQYGAYHESADSWCASSTLHYRAALRRLLVYFCISKELHIQVHILHTYGVPAHASHVWCTCTCFTRMVHLHMLHTYGAPAHASHVWCTCTCFTRMVHLHMLHTYGAPAHASHVWCTCTCFTRMVYLHMLHVCVHSVIQRNQL